MSYVPPHLRNVSSTAVATTTRPSASSGTLDHHHHNNTNLAFSSSYSHSNSSSLDNGSRRTSVAPPPSRIVTIPDTVFPNWQPSERVSRMYPDQVPLQSSFPPFIISFLIVFISSELNEHFHFEVSVSVSKFSIRIFRVFRSNLLFILADFNFICVLSVTGDAFFYKTAFSI